MPAAAAAQPPVPLLSELPDSQRRDLPTIRVTGAVYSANPAQRLLLVNNQVLPQGSTVAPGLVVEEIQANGSVFSFKGNRFRVSH